MQATWSITVATVLVAACSYSEDSAGSLARSEFPASWTRVAAFAAPSSLTLGDVGAAAIAADGTTFILDPFEGRVYIRPTDGAIRSFGRMGDGPGEFRQPFRLIAFAPHRIGVVDRTHENLTIFTTDSAPPQLIAAHSLPAAPLDYCIGQGYAAELTSDPAKSILLLDSSWSLVATVALSSGVDSTRPETQATAFFRRQGFLVCASSTRLVHVSQSAGLVSLVDVAAHRVIGTDTIPGFIPSRLSIRPGGVRLDIDPERGVADRVISGVMLCPEVAGFIVMEDRPRQDTTPRRVFMAAYNLITGHFDSLLGETPEFLALDHGLAVSRVRDPEPSAQIWTVESHCDER